MPPHYAADADAAASSSLPRLPALRFRHADAIAIFFAAIADAAAC